MATDILRTITGVFREPDGDTLPNKTLKWYRARRATGPQGSSVIVDEPFFVQTNGLGQISMQAVAGNYLVMVRLSDTDRYFSVTVPDQAGPFNIADLFDGDPIEPDPLTDFEQLVLQARAWATHPEDLEPDPDSYPGEFSALHHASKADASAADAAASAAEAALYDARIFATVADLVADTFLTYADGTAVAGETIFVRTGSLTYTVASSGASDHHLTTAGGARLYVQPDGHAYDLGAFNPAGDGVTDDGAVLALAARVANDNGRILRCGRGTFLGRFDLPDFTTEGDAWASREQLIIEGAGHGVTIFRNQAPSDDYVIGHPSFGGTSPRAQNARVVLRNFTVEGPADPASAMRGIGLSNCFKPLIEQVEFVGFVGGSYVEAWSHSKGGCQGGVMRDCRDQRVGYFIGSGGEQCYDVNDLMARCGRYALRLNGPRDTVGKANDWKMEGCHWNALVIGAVSTEGHGTALSDVSEPDGGCDNFSTPVQNFLAMEQARKIEEGTISAVASDSQFSLRTTAGTFLHGEDDTFNGFGIVVIQGGVAYRGVISDFDGATRTVTLASALPITPSTSDTYRVFFSDAPARAMFALDEHQHGLYWESRAFKADFSNNRFEEVEHVVVAHENSNHDVVCTNTYEIVGEGGGYIRQGADRRFIPYAADHNRPRGPEFGPRYSSIRKELLLAYGAQVNGSTHIGMEMTNGTGGTLEEGDVVREGTVRAVAVASANYETNEDQHYVVTSPDLKIYRDGEGVGVAVAGRFRVKIDGTASRGDLLASRTGGVAVAIPKASWTSEIVAKAVGRAIANKTTSGVGLGWAIKS